MRPIIWAIAVCFGANLAVAGQGGLHIGMKLACKRYGDAWLAGDKDALILATTDEFAAVWRAMPDAMFKKLHKSSADGAQVLASSKSATDARVAVQAPDGKLVFALDGAGFNWKVADVETSNMFGETVSLKHSVAASLAARQFLAGLNGGDFGNSLSSRFRTVLVGMQPGDFSAVRTFIPHIDEPKPTKRPVVRFRGPNAARIASAIGNGESEAVVSLVNEHGWRVDDLSVAGQGMRIPSLRDALATLAAAAKLGEFFKSPRTVDPASFAAPGKLFDELKKAFEGGPSPPNPAAAKIVHLRVADDPRLAYLKYPDKWILVSTDPTGPGRALVRDLHLHQNGKWQNAADLLALNRAVKDNPLAKLFGQAAAPAPQRQ